MFSFTAVPRGLAIAGGPAITGMFFAASLYVWRLIISGFLNISYDLLLLAMFRRIKPPEEQEG